jgi:hypothetical protein
MLRWTHFQEQTMKIDRQLQIILQVLRRGAGDTHPTIVVLSAVLLDCARTVADDMALSISTRGLNEIMVKEFGVYEKIQVLIWQSFVFSSAHQVVLIISQPHFQLFVAGPIFNLDWSNFMTLPPA